MESLFNTYPDVVSVEEMVSMLHIGKVLAYKLIKKNHIKSKRIGREYKILKADIIKYLETPDGEETK